MTAGVVGLLNLLELPAARQMLLPAWCHVLLTAAPGRSPSLPHGQTGTQTLAETCVPGGGDPGVPPPLLSLWPRNLGGTCPVILWLASWDLHSTLRRLVEGTRTASHSKAAGGHKGQPDASALSGEGTKEVGSINPVWSGAPVWLGG